MCGLPEATATGAIYVDTLFETKRVHGVTSVVAPTNAMHTEWTCRW
jgi:hypothetical protein